MHCVFINQLREKIGVMFGNPETTTGGNALKFYSSASRHSSLDAIERRRRSRQPHESEGGQEQSGPPFRRAEFDIMYGAKF